MDKKGINFYFSLFFRSLLQGLVIIGPICATIALIWYLVSSIDNLIPSVSVKFPGLVFISVIIVTALIGYIGTKFLLGRILVNAIDTLLEHMPGVKYVYTSLKDVMSSFVGDNKKLRNPVWVKTNSNPEVWRIGFLTCKDLEPLGLDDKIAVYLPHSYAISGWVMLTTTDNIRPVKGMNSAEAMKFAVSGGISGSEHTQKKSSHKFK